jgi:hypothetical protein
LPDTIPEYRVRFEVTLSARRPARPGGQPREEWLGQVISERAGKDVLLLALLEYSRDECIAACREWLDERSTLAGGLALLARQSQCPPFDDGTVPAYSEVYH